MGLIAVALTPGTARADDAGVRVSRLPLCYGNNLAVNTLLRPSGFRSLACSDVSTIPTSVCRWVILDIGTRPNAREYTVTGHQPPARLSWSDGTTVPAFVAARCRPDWDADLDESRGASLRASAAEGGLVFALAGGVAAGSAVAATASIGSCAGTLALQSHAGGGWYDVASVTVPATPSRARYDLAASVAPGAEVRLVLHAQGTCSVSDADVVVETSTP